MTRFIAELEERGAPLEEFDERLWYASVDTVTVGGGVATFTFKDGTVIEVKI